MNNFKVTRRLLLGLFFIVSAACCGRTIPPPENEIKDPLLLKGAIDARVEGFDAVRFKEVIFEYYGDQERLKVRQLILVKQPDKLRVQTRLPGSDEIVNLLVSDGETFAMHRRDTNDYLTGAPTRENLNKLLPLDLSSHDVVRVMLGGAPWDRMAQEQNPLQLAWDGKKGQYRVWVKTRAGGRFEVFVRATDFAVTEMSEADNSGDVIYTYETDDWRAYGVRSLPEFRRFQWPGEDLDFSVDVGETQVGITLPDQLFQFPPPPGSRIIEVDGNG